ncbi:MAG: DNA/RNA non-specific endonuclease [Chitinophagaceae bacterium]
MAKQSFLFGYKPSFLDVEVQLPELKESLQDDVAPVDGSETGLADYVNYSLMISASRGFPFFTASNIDGDLFKKAPRKDNWREDDRIATEHQWGPQLYRAEMSDFDKGHMTKREDVQWGDSVAIASKAADSTFYYTNAVPQHANLNQKIWRSLEDYILHTETRENDLRICVFTGPVLRKDDPFFVTEVRGERVRIPLLFWKVVMFRKKNGELTRVGFMMSQSTLLFENGIVVEEGKEAITDEDRLFMEFDGADTYQVNVATIEKLTGLHFQEASEPFKDTRKVKLILEEIDIKESFKESANPFEQLGFFINGLEL